MLIPALSMAAFALQPWSWVFATENVRCTKPQILTMWLLKECSLASDLEKELGIQEDLCSNPAAAMGPHTRSYLTSLYFDFFPLIKWSYNFTPESQEEIGIMHLLYLTQRPAHSKCSVHTSDYSYYLTNRLRNDWGTSQGLSFNLACFSTMHLSFQAQLPLLFSSIFPLSE